MSIYKDGVESATGRVLRVSSHMWMDGMEEEHAYYWSPEEGEVKRVLVGYYGSDGNNLCGASYAKVDYTRETLHAVMKALKRDAWKVYAREVTEYKQGIRKGTTAIVTRGRKVKKGTQLVVFWVGEQETYRSRQYSWMHETETVAGCYDEAGRKVWIKADYLQSIDKIKSPRPAERKKWMHDYIRRQMMSLYNINVERR